MTASPTKTRPRTCLLQRVPRLPGSFSRAALERAGFVGWATWPKLRLSDYAPIPPVPGAYVVYRTTATFPTFVRPSPAGWFKGEDPTVPESRLRAEWLDGARVVYIGKADSLRRRLTQFGRFGAGEPVGHRGGRLIWQLTDADELLVAWHEITWAEAAREYERRLLSAFAGQHDARRPFANLTVDRSPRSKSVLSDSSAGAPRWSRDGLSSQEFWHVWAVFAARVAKIPEPRSTAKMREPPPRQGFSEWS